MFTLKTLKHKIATLALVVAGSVALVGGAKAVNLVSGVWAALPGTTAAAHPELAGTIILDNLVPLKVQFTNQKGVKTIWTGKLQNRIVREKKGNLTFYYRLFSDASNTDSIQGIAMFTQTATHGFSNDADWRIDGLGTVAPNQALLNPADTEFSFMGAPLNPGQTSRFFFIRTNATNYDFNDYTFLWYGGGMFHIYGPKH